MIDLDLNAEILDTRDIIEKFEELETEFLSIYNEQASDDDFASDSEDDDFIVWLAGLHTDEAVEFKTLRDILDDLKGCGGDEQWRGDWYPITLIREDYFTDYCMELVQDIGDLPRDIPSYLEIDWQKTANNIRMDYSETDIDGNTYYFR